MSTNVPNPEKGTGSTGDFTEHFEPFDQGGKRYVRCEGCGRELLIELGGREQLAHSHDCPNA